MINFQIPAVPGACVPGTVRLCSGWFLNCLLRWLSRNQGELLLRSEAEATIAIFLFLKFYHMCCGQGCCFSLQFSRGHSLRNVSLSLLALQNLPFMKSLLSCYFLTEFLVFLLWLCMLVLLNSVYTPLSVLLCTSIFFQPTACPKAL